MPQIDYLKLAKCKLGTGGEGRESAMACAFVAIGEELVKVRVLMESARDDERFRHRREEDFPASSRREPDASEKFMEALTANLPALLELLASQADRPKRSRKASGAAGM